MAILERETASFNLAMPYLSRVNSVLNSNYTAFKNNDDRTFAINLHQLLRELSPWLQVNPDKKIDQIAPIKKMFDELSKMQKKDREKRWKKMEEIEMAMRLEFKMLGMLMPKITDPRFLFGNKQR